VKRLDQEMIGWGGVGEQSALPVLVEVSRRLSVEADTKDLY
jgi:hypothetical protein